MNIKPLLLTIFLTASASLQAQISLSGFNDALISALMVRERIPGLALAVIDSNNIATAAYGVKKAGIPGSVDTDTIFVVASLTKPITALIATRMSAAGVLDLDKPLFEYIDYKPIAHDVRHRQITARMVLSHTTGLPNARRGDGLEIYVDPGEKFGYSGEGFRYLLAAMEAIGGKDLGELGREYVFGPLDMGNTSYTWRDSYVDNVASGHNIEGEYVAEIYRLNRPYPEGGLTTNIKDYAIFIRHVLNEYNDGDAAVREMLSPMIAIQDHGEEGRIAWGVGWGLDLSDDRKLAWHTGANGTFNTFVVMDLENDRAVVGFANGNSGLSIISEIVESTLGNAYLSESYQPLIVESMN